MESQARQSLVRLLSGVDRYLGQPSLALLPSTPVIWQQGATRLLDYGGSGPAILFVPSLINRYHILDLAPQHSAVRWLAAQGLRCLILDWGTPGDSEREFDCAGYVMQRLLPALQVATKEVKGPVILAGYCMGGLLALAAAQLAPCEVKALALLATPWDFHAKDCCYTRLDDTHTALLQQLIARADTLPPLVMHALFACLNPFAFDRKFQRYGELEGEEEDIFRRLEHWVNDGVPLAQGVARDCLLSFAQQNITASGAWRVGNETIDPARLTQPAFLAMPREDRIVPPGCSAPLANMLQGSAIVRPRAGHVGMVAGTRSTAELWQPLAEWAHAA